MQYCPFREHCKAAFVKKGPVALLRKIYNNLGIVKFKMYQRQNTIIYTYDLK